MVSSQSWVNPKLEVRNTGKYGKGVFARMHIKNGERLVIFGGEVMHIDEIKNLPAEFQDHTIQIEERFVLGTAKDAINLEDADFLNHSCEPNSGFKGQIFLVAMKDIKKDEEVTFDYVMVLSKSVGSSIVFEMDCKCGAKNCRKKITEDDWKIPELQIKYNGYFQPYLQEKIDNKG